MQRPYLFYVLKHVWLASAMLFLFLEVAIKCNVFDSEAHRSEFAGHIGPGAFFLGFGTFELSTLAGSAFELSPPEVELREAWAAMGGSVLYVVVSAWYRQKRPYSLNFNYLSDYSFREQQVFHKRLHKSVAMSVMSLQKETQTAAFGSCSWWAPSH